jgi:hypothetical protein
MFPVGVNRRFEEMCCPHVHGVTLRQEVDDPKWHFSSQSSNSQPLQATDLQQQEHYPSCQLRALREPTNVSTEQTAFGIFK